jgi:hypothetical protein
MKLLIVTIFIYLAIPAKGENKFIIQDSSINKTKIYPTNPVYYRILKKKKHTYIKETILWLIGISWIMILLIHPKKYSLENEQIINNNEDDYDYYE